jgi:hypothetical protein
MRATGVRVFLLLVLVVACATNPPHVETRVGGPDSSAVFDSSSLIPYRELTRADFQADELPRELRGRGLGLGALPSCTCTPPRATSR